MKVLMASHYFGSHRGGVEIVAEALYRNLTAHQVDVIWMAGDSAPPPMALGKSHAQPLPVVNAVERRLGLPFPIPRMGAIARIVREVAQADIAVFHDSLYLTNILAFIAARLNGKPTIIIQHIGAFPSSRAVVNLIFNTANRLVTRPMLSCASQVVFISETTRRYFSRSRFRNSPEVIFNGVDTELFRLPSDSESIGSIRQEFGLDERDTIILFVGRFVEKKGLAAMRKMVERRPDWTWVFAGWGPLNPELWNAPNVRVFSHLQRPSMAALYRACDLLVLPSVGEGFPLVIQEALASGLPVVCGDETLQADPAMDELVSGAAVHFEDHDRTASGFLAAIEESLPSKETLARSRRDLAVRNYSWDQAVRRYLKVIARLVPQSNMLKGEIPAGTGTL